jgi:predicted nucleic acid-binding Zn ribbon protein
MIDVARLLPKLLNATGANPEMAEIVAKLAWSRAAGDGLRRHAIPFRLFQKTLVVSVADTIWQKQLQSMSAELVSRINRLLGREVVEIIEFRIDPATVEQVRANMQPAQSPRDEAREPIPDELISAANEIADQDLRERFIRAAENCIARREARVQSE